MKRLITLSIMAIMCSMVFAGVSHSVYVELFRFDGVTHPAAGDVTFNCYITARPEEIKTQADFGFDYNISATGYIQCNVGNFESDWESGEILRIVATEISTGNTASKDFQLTDAGYDYFPGESGIRLEASLDAPIVTISSDGNNVYLNWEAVPGALSYTVYSDNEPYGSFATIEQSAITDTTWFEALSGNMKFYRVTATN